MTEPKNAIIKQYEKLFSIENVDLEFKPEAIRAVCKKAMELKTGARGLRTIMEEYMLSLMYDTPTDPDIKKIIISEDVITSHAQAEIIKEQPVQEQTEQTEDKKAVNE